MEPATNHDVTTPARKQPITTPNTSSRKQKISRPPGRGSRPRIHMVGDAIGQKEATIRARSVKAVSKRALEPGPPLPSKGHMAAQNRPSCPDRNARPPERPGTSLARPPPPKPPRTVHSQAHEPRLSSKQSSPKKWANTAKLEPQRSATIIPRAKPQKPNQPELPFEHKTPCQCSKTRTSGLTCGNCKLGEVLGKVSF